MVSLCSFVCMDACLHLCVLLMRVHVCVCSCACPCACACTLTNVCFSPPSIEVVSPLFEGKRSLDRQRMVYKAIWEELQSAVHAVDSMVTKAPSEL